MQPQLNSTPVTRVLAPDADALAQAAQSLRAGRLVGMPTETVYGLAGDATRPDAVAAIYAAKGRPRFNPLIAHVADLKEAMKEANFDAAALKLAQAFWPGPLTIVAPARADGRVCLLARAGLASLALRAPAHPVAQALIALMEAPLAAPSANRSGRVSATTAAHVAADLAGRVDLVLDAGPSALGLESSIVACLDGKARLLRSGAIPREALEAALGRRLDEDRTVGAIAPGMAISHYAPQARLRLGASIVREREAALDFGARLSGAAHGRLDLSPNGDLVEAAANLYAHLRALDAPGVAAIAVAPIPEHGLGAAINDRLRRAAAPRPA